MGKKTIDVNDIVGNKYGRLKVLEYHGKKQFGISSKRFEHMYLCNCDCGKDKVVIRRNLINGKTSSCGCFHKEELSKRVSTHKMTNTRIFAIYNGMKRRCYTKSNDDYIYYGGRGIVVCEEWLGDDGFISFYNWSVENGYNDDLTVDRINNEGDYEPLNCRWVTRSVQSRNTRRQNKIIAISPSGDIYEVEVLKDFIEEHNLNKPSVYECLKGNWKQHKKWKFNFKEEK